MPCCMFVIDFIKEKKGSPAEHAVFLTIFKKRKEEKKKNKKKTENM